MTYRDKILNMLSNEDIAHLMMYDDLIPCNVCPLEKKCNRILGDGGSGYTCNDIAIVYLDEEVSD